MLKKQLHKFRVYSPILIVLVLVFIIANLAIVPKAFAGSFSNSTITELGGASNANPMIAGDGQALAIEFTPATTASSNPVVSLTFTGWTGGSAGSVNTTQSVSNTGCTSLYPGATGMPGTLSAAGSGAALSITSTGGTLTSGTTYCTELTSTTAVTNPTSASTYNVVVADTPDSITDTIDVLSSGANGYTIGATVGSTFTMSLSGAGTDTFSTNLSSSAVTTSTGITTTINTNATNGWFVWAKDANSGLQSTIASKTINSVSAGSNYNFSGTTGTEAYGLGVSADNTANYAYGAGSTGGALSSSTYYEIATSATQATNVTFMTHELANISSTTPPAGDYTDTITEIGAGSF